MRVISIVCLVVAVSLPAMEARAQTLPPEAKAKIEARAMSQAEHFANAKARKSAAKRGDAAYEDCYDSCISENDCRSPKRYRSGIGDAIWDLLEPVWDEAAYGYCMAAWAAGCRDGCSSLRPTADE